MLLTTEPNDCHAAFISGAFHGSWEAPHASYFVGPACRRKKSFTQSVPGQPEAAPLATPIHQGVLPVFDLMVVNAVTMSSQVFGGVVKSTPAALTVLGS